MRLSYFAMLLWQNCLRGHGLGRSCAGQTIHVIDGPRGYAAFEPSFGAWFCHQCGCSAGLGRLQFEKRQAVIQL